jgi:hypothetical protein
VCCHGLAVRPCQAGGQQRSKRIQARLHRHLCVRVCSGGAAVVCVMGSNAGACVGAQAKLNTHTSTGAASPALRNMHDTGLTRGATVTGVASEP